MLQNRNKITKVPAASLGYGFIEPKYLPEDKDEYYLRRMQNNYDGVYRSLTSYEIETLVKNGNTADDWSNILVSTPFDPFLVQRCRFYGLVRIGKLEDVALEFGSLRHEVGLYSSTIVSSDVGDNVVISNVDYLSHYIIGNEAMIMNVNELVTTNHAKFGNAIVKEGEDESVRTWIEICNENGGRKIIPFNGMLPGDAYLWSRYREDDLLLDKFKAFTEQKFNSKRGYYGKIGDRTVIKNCKTIKDVWVGSDAYIKGANKLKNLTINSGPEGKSQVGEGVELVNGIIEPGCRIFYGAKAVRFIMGAHSQLKYGARLINSYLGDNATISCCEVLNSLIFPAHEQHHNNSFLCAALVMGQSNVAAGATLGSNHNSRSPDGEMVAGRGFWPGLCVSIKHNSKFASFTILAKGDYPAELNITLPFALVSNDVSKDQLVVMPGYWFLYNMYALVRNSAKYADRDKRRNKVQHLEYDYLAPDTVNEIWDALKALQLYTGRAFYRQANASFFKDEDAYIKKGTELLEANDPLVDELEILGEGFEHTRRKTIIAKTRQAYHIYKKMLRLYGISALFRHLEKEECTGIEPLQAAATGPLESWINVGGQLIPEPEVERLKTSVKDGTFTGWPDVHHFYTELGNRYNTLKQQHAFATLEKITGISLRKITASQLHGLLTEYVKLEQWVAACIYDTREKDYTNSFRSMMYDTMEQMEAVVGKLEDNSFIHKTQENFTALQARVAEVIGRMHLKL